jgi:hypothetical protein
MATYVIDVHHRDRYEFEADSAAEAINIAKNCVADNYGGYYQDQATFDAIRVDKPAIGDPSDAGMDGA